MKKLIAFLTTISFLFIGYNQAFAMDNIDLEIPDTGKSVHFEAKVPDEFDRDIEIYLDRSAYYMTNESGYSIDLLLEPDEYEVRTIISGDLYNQYKTEHADTLDTTRDDTFLITVLSIETTEEDGTGEEHNFENQTEEMETMPEPEIFDYSNGDSYGTLMITAKTYSAVDSVSFRLVGSDRVYDIPLTSAGFGRAEVRLPTGSYYESASLDVMLDEDAELPESYAFLWQHDGRPGVWGSYYDIKEGETVTIDDLILVMSSGSQTAEVSSNLLFAKTYAENRVKVQERDRQNDLESAFPEIYGTAEDETIAQAESIQTDRNGMLTAATVKVIVAVIAVIGICSIAIFIKKKKS